MVVNQTDSKCRLCGKTLRGRSNNQNRYYWSVVLGLIAEETGHTTEELHEFLKSMFLPRTFIQVGKREREIVKSTTDLSTADMEGFLTRVRVFASQELNVFIPLPNEAPL